MHAAVDHTSAYFALAGALGAALLAIVGSQFGDWRQRKADAQRLERQLAAEKERLDRQLEAERDRLDITLKAEANRLATTLQSARQERDLEIVRERVGSLIEDTVENVEIVARLVGRLNVYFDSGKDAALVRATRRELQESGHRLLVASVKLGFFFKSGDPLIDAFRSISQASDRVHDAMSGWDGEEVQASEIRETVAAANDAHTEASAIFTAVAARLVGASTASEDVVRVFLERVRTTGLGMHVDSAEAPEAD